jgi:hypothetical protein
MHYDSISQSTGGLSVSSSFEGNIDNFVLDLP